MKNKIRLALFLFFLIPFGSKAAMPPDSIGVRKADGKTYIIHKIDSAQGWYSIARMYNVTYAELRLANKDSADKLIPGHTLLVPTNKLKADDPHYDKNYIQDSGEQFYNVKAGETLFSIAKRFNTNVDSLKKWNNLKKGGLQTGMKLKVGNRSSKVLEKSALSAADENAGKEKVTEKSPEKTEIKNNAGSKSGSGTGITPKKDLSVDESLLKKNIETARDSSRHAEKDAQDMENKTGGTKPDSSKEKKNTGVQTKVIKTASASSDAGNASKNSTSGKNDPKKTGTQTVAKARREVTENGVASWIQDDDINPNKYYALHRTAPIGTIIKVTNKMNKKYVFVKVVGTLPDTGDNTDLLIKISKASAEKLGVRDSRFQSELSYGMNEKQ